MIGEELLYDLRSFLFHLYDPAYPPGDPVRTLTGCPAEGDAACSRAAVLDAIESLRPPPDVPVSSRLSRLYQLLLHRFVQSRTQEETSGLLGLTPRHLRREEREAIVLLAHRLLELSAKPDPVRLPTPLSPHNTRAVPSDWSSQLQQELTLLHKSEKGEGCDVAEVVYKTADLCRPLSRLRRIDLVVAPLEAGLRTLLSPAVLRQALVMMLEALLACSAEGRIDIRGERTGNFITLRLIRSPQNPEIWPNWEKVGTLLSLQGTACQIFTDPQQMTIGLELLPVRETTVLVIDDNPDIVYLYGRYVAGTCYRLLRAEEDAPLFSWIELHAPDIIVLDIMMPQVDGWELLTELHEHPATRSIPVIVCSVIKGELLAHSLGAALYRTKPITQEQFLSALDLAAARLHPQQER